jgi:hypothetical protein
MNLTPYHANTSLMSWLEIPGYMGLCKPHTGPVRSKPQNERTMKEEAGMMYMDSMVGRRDECRA